MVSIAVFALLLFCHRCYANIINCSNKLIVNGIELNGISSYAKTSEILVSGENLTSDKCTIWQYAYDVENTCENLEFLPLKTGYFSVIGKMNSIQNYNFNITFTNITWKFMRLRSRLLSPQEGVMPWCLQLYVANGFMPWTTLSFAPHYWWPTSEAMELEVAVGETDAVQGYGRLLMYAPPLSKLLPQQGVSTECDAVNITKWVIPVALDVSLSPTLTVLWPEVPHCFNVTSYKVSMFAEELPQTVLASNCCSQGTCRLEQFVGWFPQKVFAKVVALHPYYNSYECCGQSPEFILGLNLPVYLWTMMVVSTLLLLIAIGFIIYFFCCSPPFNIPKVLFIYDATENNHTRASRFFVKYLEEKGGLKCLFDVDAVPHHKSKNASKWLHEAFETCDVVVVMASPTTHSPIRYTHYPYVFSEALPLIQRRFQCKGRRDSERRILLARPIYLSKEDLHPELRGLRDFRVPDEVSELLWNIYHHRMNYRPIAFIVHLWLRTIGCPGLMTRIHHDESKRLIDAFEVAYAHQVIMKQLPSPAPSTYSLFTYFKDGQEVSDCSASCSESFPGRLTNYNLSGGRVLSVSLPSLLPSSEPPLRLGTLWLGPRDCGSEESIGSP